MIDRIKAWYADHGDVAKHLETDSTKRALGIALAVMAVVGLASVARGDEGHDHPTAPSTESSASSTQLGTEVVGETQGVEGAQPGASWPGEIVSSGDVDVQPPREGTITDLSVTIGQAVTQGQVLARLSAAPPSPELVGTLAEKAQEMAQGRAVLETTTSFAERRRQQLSGLWNQIVTAGQAVTDGTNAATAERSAALSALQSVVEASRRDAQLKADTLRDFAALALRSIYPLVSPASGTDPVALYQQNPQAFGFMTFRNGVGDFNPQTRAVFVRDLNEAARALVAGDPLLAEHLRQFLRSADALAVASRAIPPPQASSAAEGSEARPASPQNPSDLTQEMLSELRSEMVEQSSQLIDRLTIVGEANLEATKSAAEMAAARAESAVEAASLRREVAGATLDVTEKLSSIDEALLGLEREVAMARAEATAAQATYATVAQAFGRDVTITAPRAGVISTVLKKAGDFVEPGDPIASVNGGENRVIRFRIPGNGTPPASGQMLMAIRPGFPREGKQVKVLGVGGSLDENGTLLADATFVEAVNWPVHGAVRVLAPEATGEAPLVSLSAVWWDDQGRANLWTIGADDRLEARPVKTGRALGDRIEILEGAGKGTRVVSEATEGLRTGMKLPSGPAPGSATSTTQGHAGDGHDHEH